MKFEPTALPGIIKIVPTVHEDSRGFLMETWQASDFAEGGIDAEFVEENFSHSRKGTLRGLHYQIEKPQGRLVRVVQGAVFDVSVDLKNPCRTSASGSARSSPRRTNTSCGCHPASGTDFYAPEDDRSIRWDDPDIGIEWPLTPGEELILSDKDAAAPNLKDAEIYP